MKTFACECITFSLFRTNVNNDNKLKRELDKFESPNEKIRALFDKLRPANEMFEASQNLCMPRTIQIMLNMKQ